MSEQRIGGWMQTASGILFYPLDPRVEEVNLDDIAGALSKLCRFGGHCLDFYSVAEHSVLVSEVVPPEYALQALLHDATEAYIVDVPRPIKKQLTNYAMIEDKIWRVIAEKFGVDYEMHECVKRADNDVLLAECKQIVRGSPTFGIEGTPADVHVTCLDPYGARDLFLHRFHQLAGSRA